MVATRLEDPFEKEVREYLLRRYGQSEPSLYTALSLIVDGEEILFSSHDILQVARDITQEIEGMPGELTQGQGTEENPYILVTVKQWLDAAIFLKGLVEGEKIYFRINNKLISVDHDRKASSVPTASSAPEPERDIVGLLLSKRPEAMIVLAQDLLAFGDGNYIKKLINTIDNPSIGGIVSAVLPLANYLIQRLNDDLTPEESLEKPAYGTLKYKHETETLSVEKPKSPLEEGMSAVISVEDQTKVMDALNLPELSRTLDQLPGALGFGTAFSLLLQGTFPRKREMTMQDMFKNMISTALTLLEPAPASPIVSELKSFQENPRDLLTKLISDFKEASGDAHTIKAIQALRSSDNIKEVWRILGNEETDTSIWYFPVMIAALFLSETSRYSTSFIASLALLDLIQEEAPCPDIEGSYNLFNGIQDTRQRSRLMDGEGRIFFAKATDIANETKRHFRIPSEAEKNRRASKKYNRDEVRKINIINGYTNERRLEYNVSGYLPMAHGNSFHEVKDIEPATEFDTLVIPQQKAASILIQWLSIKLNQTGLQTTCKKIFFRELKALQESQPDRSEHIKTYLYPLLKVRMESFHSLLSVESPETSALSARVALNMSELFQSSAAVAPSSAAPSVPEEPSASVSHLSSSQTMSPSSTLFFQSATPSDEPSPPPIFQALCPCGPLEYSADEWLSLVQGQRVIVIDNSDPERWLCESRGQVGYVPSGYLEPISNAHEKVSVEPPLLTPSNSS